MLKKEYNVRKKELKALSEEEDQDALELAYEELINDLFEEKNLI